MLFNVRSQGRHYRQFFICVFCISTPLGLLAAATVLQRRLSALVWLRASLFDFPCIGYTAASAQRNMKNFSARGAKQK
jgi:hypothetical protein